jgi:hypothetical protein
VDIPDTIFLINERWVVEGYSFGNEQFFRLGKQRPFSHSVRRVELKQFDRDSPGRTCRDNQETLEMKVPLPFFLTRIEERRDHACGGINGGQVASFEEIAGNAAKGQIAFLCFPVVLLSDDVVDLMRLEANDLRNPTIFTPPGGPSVYQPAQSR